MDKKSTILLTVIAVATLLVAVVGSTFAFFAIQETNTADVKVETSTAAGSDQFTAVSSGDIKLTINNDDMLQANGGADVVAAIDEDSTITVSLKAGSGVATCKYNLVWTETSTIPYARSKYMVEGVENTVTGMEYTLAGSATVTEGTSAVGPVEEINVSDIHTSGNLYATKDGELVEEKFEISNTYGEATTVQTWTFTNKFYNLAVDQGDQMGKTYAGNITVANVECSNEATTTAE